MPSLKKFFEAIDYKVQDGYLYGWDCYGETAFGLDASNRNGYSIDGWYAQVIYDLKTQKVYEINFSDHYVNEFGRWIHPDYVAAHKREAKKRGFPHNRVYDDKVYVDMSDRTILTKLAAAVAKGKKTKGKSKK